MLLLHPDLAHCGAANLSPQLRQMLYFRIRAATAVFADGSDGWEELVRAHMQDLWADLKGVQRVLGKELRLLDAIYLPS